MGKPLAIAIARTTKWDTAVPLGAAVFPEGEHHTANISLCFQAIRNEIEAPHPDFAYLQSNLSILSAFMAWSGYEVLKDFLKATHEIKSLLSNLFSPRTAPSDYDYNHVLCISVCPEMLEHPQRPPPGELIIQLEGLLQLLETRIIPVLCRAAAFLHMQYPSLLDNDNHAGCGALEIALERLSRLLLPFLMATQVLKADQRRCSNFWDDH
jgi:hypothetical protein